MNTPVESLSPEEVGIVKAAAAETYKAMGIRPVTASYVFDRFLQKQAALAGIKPAPSPKAVKLAEALKRVIHAQRPAA